jgi:hypothetical protein
MKEIIDIARVLVSPAEKLIDVAKSGIGTLYEPKHIRKMADARAYEIDTISEAVRRNPDQIIQYRHGAVDVEMPEFAEFVQRTQCRLAYQELQKQQNIESVMDHAYDVLEQETAVTNEPIAQDWINRFFNCVEDIGDTELQMIFGKILAGEIRQPRSFSKRTLDTIRNLSQYEAKVFQMVTPFIVRFGRDIFIPSDQPLLEKYGIRYVDLMLLKECGLLSTADRAGLTYNLTQGDEIAVHNNREMIKVASTTTGITHISIGAYALTTAGRELYSIMEFTPCYAYLYDLAKSIYHQNKKVCVTIHKINYVHEDEINYKETAMETINGTSK